MATLTESIALEGAWQEKVTRFDVQQIIQHAGLMVSFILLVLTGLPQKFHELAISQWWTGLLGGIEVTRSIHHFAAWLIVLVCLYHLVYIAYSTLVQKRPFPVKMIPGRHDFITLYQEIKYFLGITRERPRFDRFNWREKFDYWAIFWGMPVMGISGFILMYPVEATHLLPGWVVPAALIAHSDEAMLALTWIFLVHIFFNHFSPGIFPLNTSIFTGKVSKERYQREHPLEYERLSGGQEGIK
ncbi:MAG: cytochrome b/b6 domain-containing protein [Chloroflexota bacterium]|nr:cytochrome b/b6 domain-containing protein [Chloroflexota bacterium]